MSWNVMKEMGGSKAINLSKKLCKAKKFIEEVCDEIDEMEEYFGERDDDDDDYDDMMERRGRSRRGGRY